jgi:myo-inositol-1(or 4)-monophosphatase
LTETQDLQLENRRRVAEEACRAAAEVQLKYRQPAIPFEIKMGNRRDLVTIADTEAQTAAIAVIQSAYPDEPIVGEENAPSREQIGEMVRDRCWLIDPLDGTFNFVHGFPDFSATVAFVSDGHPVAGATYAPLFGEMFSASRGQGATLNGQRIHVSERKGLERSIVNVFLGRQGDPALRQQRLSLIQQRALQQRTFGGTAIVMAYLAAGRFDLFYVAEASRMGDWDVAAGAILIEEAGGSVTQADGQPFHLPFRNIACAADPATLQELRDLICE